MREVLALAVVAKAAKISSMVDSYRTMKRQKIVSVQFVFIIFTVYLIVA